MNVEREVEMYLEYASYARRGWAFYFCESCQAFTYHKLVDKHMICHYKGHKKVSI